MFTGLVEGVGTVVQVRRGRDEMVITLSPPFDVNECAVGESIAVDGVCLTVTDIGEGLVSMYVSGETLSRTTLHLLRRNMKVNMERALRLADRLGGHMVSGHVDGTGRIQSREQRERSSLIRFTVEARLSRYIIEKGSVAVDGISLTVNNCDRGWFEVNVIPQTGKETTILEKKTGDLVNIETDIIGKYVESLLYGDTQTRGAGSKIDMDFIRQHGFGE